ncbi:hypothetical protein niasHT_001186 [Heterodera trifolii]
MMQWNSIAVEEQRPSFHETGHAVACWLDRHCAKIVFMTIEPAEGSRGETRINYRELYTKNELTAYMKYFLGSTIAETLIFNNLNRNGAFSDLVAALKAAEIIVCRFDNNPNPPTKVPFEFGPELKTACGPKNNEKANALVIQTQDEMVELFKTKEIMDVIKELAYRLLEKKILLEGEIQSILSKIQRQ